MRIEAIRGWRHSQGNPCGLPSVDDAGAWRDLVSCIPGYDPFSASSDDYVFCPAHAIRAIEFFELMLTHIEGSVAGKPFVLSPFQRAMTALIFGALRSEDESRRYREVFIYIPRKNGKTPYVAGLALATMFLDGEVGGQSYCAASGTEQAAYMFRHAVGMIEKNPALLKLVNYYKTARTIVHEPTMSFFRVISAIAETKHGGNPHFIAIDELHAQPNRELVDVLRTSMASANRRQPMMVYLTTADVVRPSVCNETYRYACNVRDGVADDPAFLPVIYEAIHGRDDWKDEKTWAHVNPNLGVSVSIDYLRRECKKASSSPSLENSFKRLHLNMQTEQAERWISMDSWRACEVEEVPDYYLRECPCWGGLDVSSTVDLTAFVLVFDVREVDATPCDYYIKGWYWLPAESVELRAKRDRVPYIAWRDAGYVNVCDGGVIDLPLVRSTIVSLCCESYPHVREIAADPHHARLLLDQLLNDDGLPVYEHLQTAKSYSDPCSSFFRLVTSGQIGYNDDPVLSWAVGNLAVTTDTNENIRPVKSRSFERIDPAVAAIMAVGRATMGDASDARRRKSVYDRDEDSGVVWL